MITFLKNTTYNVNLHITQMHWTQRINILYGYNIVLQSQHLYFMTNC